MTIKTSDLDFNNIKESLKTYLRQTDEFSDYNFEASGLSSILDVLAYNTHLNGLIANMAVNESFLGSAQLRSSVVSHAETLGYFPKSQTAAQATVNVSVSVPSVSSLTLPAGTEFTSDIDGVNYTFITTEDYNALSESGTFNFQTSNGSPNIRIIQGIVKTKTFAVGESSDEQVFVIPDDTVDTSTLNVKVYDSFNTTTFTSYKNINEVPRVGDDSTIYIVREAPNGNYELFFSDGNILGKSPVAGNKIVVEYVSSVGSVANGATVFTTDNILGQSVTVTTVGESAGGSSRETIQSIKLNAPQSFASQQRLVTAEDYKALILSNYGSYVDDAISWGGNDNIPPQYGKVFVSLNFIDGIDDSTKEIIKTSIEENLTSNLSIMSIDTVFVDPQYTYLELQTTFNLDPNQTGQSAESIGATVQDTIRSYVESNLDTFDAVFRRSNILAAVDDVSPAVLNSRMVVRGQQRIELDDRPLSDFPIKEDFTVTFPFELKNPSNEEYVIETSIFDYNGVNCIIRNELGSTKLQIVDLAGNVRLSNIGSYNPANGTVQLLALQFESNASYVGSSLKVSALPANQSTLRPLRNYIITIDTDKSFSKAVIDTQSTRNVL